MKKVHLILAAVALVSTFAIIAAAPAVAGISTACIILMAIVQNPLIGRSKQQAGGMVFSKMYDKNVIRSKPFSYNDRNSDEQKTQRNFFKSITTMVSLMKDQARSFFYSQPTNKSAYSAILSSILTESSLNLGVRSINPATTYFGNGKYNLDCFLSARAIDGSSMDCDVLWTAAADLPVELRNALVQPIFFNLTQNKTFIGTPTVAVTDESLSVDFPSDWASGDDFICYLGAVHATDATCMRKYKAGADLANKVK